MLLLHGAPVNEVGCDMSHALIAASAEGHLRCVKELIAAGANLDLARDTDGATALYVACEHDDRGVAKVCAGVGCRDRGAVKAHL